MDHRRRILTIIAALAGATLLAIAVQGGRWWDVGDVTIGPISSHHCYGGDCQVGGLAWVGAGAGWARAGQATYVAALLSAALLVFVAAALAAKRVIPIVAKSGLVAIATAVIAAGAFVAMFPGLAGASLGRGAWLFAGGVVLAIAAQVSIVRARR